MVLLCCFSAAVGSGAMIRTLADVGCCDIPGLVPFRAWEFDARSEPPSDGYLSVDSYPVVPARTRLVVWVSLCFLFGRPMDYILRPLTLSKIASNLETVRAAMGERAEFQRGMSNAFTALIC